jgi:hypothetical protein
MTHLMLRVDHKGMHAKKVKNASQIRYTPKQILREVFAL